MPLFVVTVTSTVPEPEGDTAVMDVALLTVKADALAPPKRTAVAPVNPLPVMVNTVPPDAGPDVGAIDVTVGDAI